MSQGGTSTSALVLYAVFVTAALVCSTLPLRPRMLPSAGTDVPTGKLLEHVRRIAAAPHSLGTLEHDRVRDYIVSVLKDSGTAPEIQHATSVLDTPELFRIADVQNILVRLPGTDAHAPAILVASHYDSAPASLGAADDGAAVAVMLELARALHGASPLRNSIILLFSDGEEWGLLGARSFLEHPWAKQVAATINLDARGSSGRPVLIELAGDEGKLLSLLSGTGSLLWTGSYATAGYVRSGYDTDFSVFKRANWPGYNLVFFDDPSSYHTLRDSVDRLNPATIWQQAEIVHALTRKLGNARLDLLQHQATSFYATLPGGFLMKFSDMWSKALGAIPILMLLLVMFRARPDWGPVLNCLGRIATAIVLSSLLMYVLNRAVSAQLETLVRWEQHDAFFAGALCAAAGLSWCAVSLRNSASRKEYLLAFTIATACLSVISSILSAQVAGLFSVPSICACCILLMEHYGRLGRVQISLIHSLGLLPAVLLWFPAILVTATGLGLKSQIVVVPLAALLACGMACLPLPALARNGLRVPLIAFGVSAVCYGAGWHNAKFDFRNPIEDHLLLTADLNSQTAHWATFDAKLDVWNGRFVAPHKRQNLRDFFGGNEFPVYASPARVPAFAGSRLIETDVTLNDVRLLLKPEPGVSAVRMDFYFEGNMRSVLVNHKPLQPRRENAIEPGHAKLTLTYLNPPGAGVPIALTLSGSRELRVSVVDARYHGVQDGRPSYVVPSPLMPTDCAFIRGTFQFVLPNQSGKPND